METRKLKDFVVNGQDQIAKKIKANFNPIYDLTNPPKSNADRYGKALKGLGKTPFPAQRHFISALAMGYKRGKKSLAAVAEMASGKTLMGIMTTHAVSADVGRPLRTLVICPPSLISTWAEELRSIYGQDVRIVDVSKKDSMSKLIRARQRRKEKPAQPEFWLMSFSIAKLGYGQKNVNLIRKFYDSKSESVLKEFYCEHCGKTRDDICLSDKTKRLFCPNCGNPFFGPDGRSSNRYPLSTYIKKYLKNYFDFMLADEVHQLKGETLQGVVLGQLAKSCRKSLVLTGTLSGGKASDIFYILQRTIALNYNGEEREHIFPKYSNRTEFVQEYGVLEKVYRQSEDDAYFGRSGKRTNVKEKPGVSPLVLKQYFIENAVFMRLSDIANALPDFREELEFVQLPDDLQSVYNDFQSKVRQEALEALKRKDHRVLGQMLNNLLAWPDFPQKGATIYDNENNIVASAPEWDIDKTPKDERLIEILRENRRRGRKVLIFTEYTGPKWRGDYSIAEMLTREGFRPLVLKSNIAPPKRLDWIRKNSAGYDCLICQPRLVEVGMNLLEYPEIVFYQTGYNIYSLRQASRRSYRPGQKREVVVRYLINEQTAQDKAMALIASKLEAALVLEGELSDQGLVALSEMGDSMAVELARAIVEDIDSGAEKIFSRYKQAEVISNSMMMEETDQIETEQVVETSTKISKGNASVSFKTRRSSKKIEPVGQISFDANTQRGSGVFYGKTVSMIENALYTGTQKLIGHFADENSFEVVSRKAEGKYKTKVSPGMFGLQTISIYQMIQ